ncbi:O-antigen ligase [Sphingomonas sp. BK345]|uniref:O-antigen ligase family protein n=1 Tax=Sphingomonas sp. BK345 TaxID=2586980 RepID=UPI00161D9997|nr:O-antigen ligase family protein [Sphingomonas sp. BK345]MBB3475337.1 O-antigen ligase [Sphingomonas sp. BK345]
MVYRAARGWIEQLSSSDRWTRLVASLALLPIAAGLTFRTYSYGVHPSWFEVVRQLDLFYAAVEIAVVLLARHRGFSYAATFRRMPRGARVALVLFLATFWWGTVFVTGPMPFSLMRAALWPIHLLFGAALWHLCPSPDADAVRRWIMLLVAGSIAYLPLLAVHFLTAPTGSPAALEAIVWTSALPGYLSVRHFGIEWGAVLTLAIGLVWRDPRALGGVRLGFAALLLLGGAVCWSGTRAALFGVAGAIALTIVGRRHLPRPASVLLVATALLLGGAVAQQLLPPSESFGFRITPPATGVGGFTSGRVDLWVAALHLFRARPLTGWGEGSMMWLVNWHGVSFAHPHNTPIQMLESWGIAATAAALYLIARLWAAVQRRDRARENILPLQMALDALLIMSLVDGVFYHARLVMLVALVAAVALSAPAASAAAGKTARAFPRAASRRSAAASPRSGS